MTDDDSTHLGCCQLSLEVAVEGGQRGKLQLEVTVGIDGRCQLHLQGHAQRWLQGLGLGVHAAVLASGSRVKCAHSAGFMVKG